jgi:putative ABC transport system permease protein
MKIIKIQNLINYYFCKILSMLKDYFKISIKGLFQRKLRSWLTMIGIFIGIGTIVLLISLGQGLNNAVLSQFGNLNSDIITITAGSDSSYGPFADSSNPLTDKELNTIKTVSGVNRVAQRELQPSSFTYDDIETGAMIASVPSGKARELIYDFLNMDIESGRNLVDSDNNKVVLGNVLAHKKDFSRPIKAGDIISIKDSNYEVVGVFEKQGSFIFDNIILMNEDVMYELYGIPKGEYSIIAAEMKEGQNIEIVMADIERRLRKVRDVKEETQDFTVSAAIDQIKTIESSLFAVQLFIYMIAGISIIVGGIGILNTMFTSVLERTKEIGIMKSIGARNSSIFTLFFIESGLLGLIGGVVGVLIGSFLSFVAEKIAYLALKSDLLQSHISPTLVIGALLFSFIIGALSGIIPAMQAAKMNPVDALRKTN